PGASERRGAQSDFDAGGEVDRGRARTGWRAPVIPVRVQRMNADVTGPRRLRQSVPQPEGSPPFCVVDKCLEPQRDGASPAKRRAISWRTSRSQALSTIGT